MKVLPIERLDARKDAALRRAGYLTFDGWSARGRLIRKGAKSSRRNSHGTALFHEDQTRPIVDGGYFAPWDQDDDRDWLDESWVPNG